MASTFLTRLRLGEILVDAKGVSRLYRPLPGRSAAGRRRAGRPAVPAGYRPADAGAARPRRPAVAQARGRARARVSQPPLNVRLPLPRAVAGSRLHRARRRAAARRRDRRQGARLVGAQRPAQLAAQRRAPAPTSERDEAKARLARAGRSSSTPPTRSSPADQLRGRRDRARRCSATTTTRRTSIRQALEPTGATCRSSPIVRDERRPRGARRAARAARATRRSHRTPTLLDDLGQRAGIQMVRGGRLVGQLRTALLQTLSGEFGGLDGVIVMRPRTSRRRTSDDGRAARRRCRTASPAGSRRPA